ncbi:MAG: sulfurtransferase-like selenium metabolism protein YedF [Deltaproteobacteria bacterium]|nr:sulfurtransferase-like selenium metabolism protein YedF [Deltaproteobacteria bacterium]
MNPLGRTDPSAASLIPASETEHEWVAFISSEGMGHGDEELGAKLMASFLGTLLEFRGKLSHLLFVNAGAKLVAEGSGVLDQLKSLEEAGVELLVCGTCLEHFDLGDRLAVGSVSGMFTIVETLSRARRIIQP